MTTSKHIHAPRKSAVTALKALRKHAKDYLLGPLEIAEDSGMKYATVWLWLTRSSANYNLTHESEGMINLYLEEAKIRIKASEEKQMDLWNDNTEQSTDNTTVIPKAVRVNPNKVMEPTGITMDKEPEDALLVLPKKEVLAIVSAGLNKLFLNGQYAVADVSFEGESGRILFREKKS
jgi:hypothetical protein